MNGFRNIKNRIIREWAGFFSSNIYSLKHLLKISVYQMTALNPSIKMLLLVMISWAHMKNYMGGSKLEILPCPPSSLRAYWSLPPSPLTDSSQHSVLRAFSVLSNQVIGVLFNFFNWSVFKVTFFYIPWYPLETSHLFGDWPNFAAVR